MTGPSLTFKDLIALKNKAGLVFSDRYSSSSSSGGARSIAKGRGLEFTDTRPYMYGDDARFIDWRLTARKQKTYLKLFTEEKEQQIFIVCDLRSSMNFATKGQLKSHAAATLSALIGWSSLTQHHQVGAVLLTDTRSYTFPISRTQDSFLRFLKKTAELLEQPVQRNEPVHSTLPTILDRHTLLFYISDFYMPAPAKLKPLRKLFIPVVDPLEETPPPKGAYLVTDGHSFFSFNAVDKKKYREPVKARQNDLSKRKIPFKVFRTPDDPLVFLKSLSV